MPQSTLVRRIWVWTPLLIYMLTIWAVSSMEHVTVVDAVPLKDKTLHAIEYCGMGLLCAHALAHTWPKAGWFRIMFAALLASVGWGLLDEFHQAFVPNRSADIQDVMADTIGAFAGVIFRRIIPLRGGPLAW